MLNKEYYRDLLVKSGIEQKELGLNEMTGEPTYCDELSCMNCDFNDNKGCLQNRRDWANKEYKQAEKRIHWELVPLDTQVYIISDSYNDFPAYFASYSSGTGKIRVFNNGRTSFTADIKETQEYSPEQIRLARKTDIKKYER